MLADASGRTLQGGSNGWMVHQMIGPLSEQLGESAEVP